MSDQIPTLYQDWQKRCALLRERPPAGAEAFAPAQIHVLEYLLKRYDGAPEAAQPARFAQPSPTILFKRTIVVHHHLGVGRISGIKSKEEAHSRASRILTRLAAHGAQASAQSPAGGALFAFEREVVSFRNSQDLGYFGKKSILPPNWRTTLHQLSPLEKRFLADLCANRIVKLMHCKELDRSDALEVLRILGGCHLIDEAFESWAERALWSSMQVGEIEEYLMLPGMRTESADLFRAAQSSERPQVRARSLFMIRQLNHIQDVGFLSDLLNLPPQSDEYDSERNVLLGALQSLASACTDAAEAKPPS